MDKVQKIKAEIERRYNEYMAKDSELAAIRADECLGILSFIDSMQEECNITGVKSRHATGKLKECIDLVKKDKFFSSNEGEYLEEETNYCAFSTSRYTDEDRKTLCEGCEEKCEYAQKEADWLQELHCKLDSLSKEDFEKVWAKYAQKEEPASEDLDIAASEYLKQNYDVDNIYEEDDLSIRNTFKAGAKWQKEQFEKNRLKHCNSITNKQAELEQGFIDQHLDKYNRMPTFFDAIEYGMKLQRENMMKDAVDAVVHIEAGNYPYIPQLELYDYDKDIPLAKEGDKYKVVLIKEE